MDAQAPISIVSSAWRRAAMTLAVVGVVFVGMIAAALPASATELGLSGRAVCSGGSHVITWTITNTDPSNTVTITSALAAKDPVGYDVTGYSPTLAPGATTHGTTVIPGTATGGVVLYVYETWDDSEGSDQVALDLGDPCSTATTTTSTTAASTTTTTPTTATTTTSIAPASTSTVVVAGSTVASTAPGSSTTVAPISQLPRTGSGSTGAIAGAATLALGGLALALSAMKRRPAR